MTDQPTDRTAVDEAAAADHTAVSEDVAGRDGGPIDEQDMAAADQLDARSSVRAEYADMLERGAQQRGEGRIP